MPYSIQFENVEIAFVDEFGQSFELCEGKSKKLGEPMVYEVFLQQSITRVWFNAVNHNKTGLVRMLVGGNLKQPSRLEVSAGAVGQVNCEQQDAHNGWIDLSLSVGKKTWRFTFFFEF